VPAKDKEFYQTTFKKGFEKRQRLLRQYSWFPSTTPLDKIGDYQQERFEDIGKKSLIAMSNINDRMGKLMSSLLKVYL
jgi:hypothetical protein